MLSSFYHIVLPAANSLHARDRDWLFPFGEDNYGCLDGCVCVSMRLCVHACVCICFLAKTNSDDTSGTFKKPLNLDPFTHPQTWA